MAEMEPENTEDSVAPQIPQIPVKMPVIDPRDPWLGRDQGMRCRTCMWFAQKNDKLGRCRRRAPSLHGFPVVFHVDWCGDHRMDENVK